MQIQDPPTAAQVSVILERVMNLSEDVRETRSSMERMEKTLTDIAVLRKDHEHLADAVRQLHTVAEVRGVAHNQLDKRVLTLENWHKYRILQPAVIVSIVTAALGYWWGFLGETDAFRQETQRRMQSVEFIVNAPGYEHAMSQDKRPIAEGKK